MMDTAFYAFIPSFFLLIPFLYFIMWLLYKGTKKSKNIDTIPEEKGSKFDLASYDKEAELTAKRNIFKNLRKKSKIKHRGPI